MIEKIKGLLVKYREIIVYLIVGVMTTIFSWGVLFVGKFFLNTDISWQNFLNNTISWVAGVVFAYPLNRKWVFKSTNSGLVREFLGFASSRVSTWVLDVFIMWLFVNVWTLEAPIRVVCGWLGYPVDAASLGNLNYWFVKIFISSVLVTIANYVFSKLFVFRKKAGNAAGTP